MRVDCREGPVGLTAHGRVWELMAFIDGEPVRDCFFADEEEGTVGCYVRDEAGKIIFDLEEPPYNPRERWIFEAKVEIRLAVAWTRGLRILLE